MESTQDIGTQGRESDLIKKTQGLEGFSKSRVAIKKDPMFHCHSKSEYQAEAFLVLHKINYCTIITVL